MRSVWSARLLRAVEFFQRFFCAGIEAMADEPRRQDERKDTPDEEAALSARLDRLGERLKSVSRPSENVSGPRTRVDASALARGFRLSSELVAGVVVGALIGWLIDRWLGISPWGMIVFLLAGFAAGVLNVMRAAGVAPHNRMK
jgi:ATP synthase protein I